MKGDTKRTKLIEAIMYDTKPVHYISVFSEELKWFVMEKDCFNIDTVKVYIFIFLRMKYINKYMNVMWGAGISDNLSNYYRIYFGVKNRKWRCYILFWDVDVILNNAYIIYI